MTSISAYSDDFQSSILSPSAADTIAMITMGLSYSDSDWSKPMLVTPAHVAKGYEIFLDAHRRRASWTDLDEENKAAVLEDPIVKKVKQSKLSDHESGLLKCVVDAG
jgi:hypothetical protein